MPEYSKPTSLGTIWADGGDKIKPSDDKIQTGWLPEIPTRQNFNWLDNRQDQFNAHVNQHGIAVWDSNTDYIAGKSYTQGSDGLIYRSKVDNRGINPVVDTGFVSWEVAFVTPDGYVGGKRFVGFESFSTSFTATANHRYFVSAPSSVTLPTTANQGDAVVVAKRSDIVVMVGQFSLSNEDMATFVFDNNMWVRVSDSLDDNNSVTLSGPVIATQGSTVNYTITNFNSFSQYSVGTSVGTISRTDGVITLVVPNPTTATQINMTVTRDENTSLFLIAVGAQSIATPVLTYPSEGQSSVELSPTLQSSAFATVPAGQTTHQSSQWEISADSDFTTLLFDSGADTVNKTSIQVPSGVLSISQTYYARVRHTGVALGTSGWSPTRTFTTTDRFVVTPTVNVTGGPSSVSNTPTITTSAFSVSSGTDTHVSTNWQILLASNSNVVWQSLGNTANKTSIVVPSGILLESTNYIARAQHTSTSLGSSSYGGYSFTTVANFVPTVAGTPYEGGYYVGRIIQNGSPYALVVAPKSSGQFQGAWSTTSQDIPYAVDLVDGLSNTNQMITSPSTTIASLVKAMTTGGKTDWAVPAKYQLEMLYRMFKPGTTPNAVGGENPASVPVGVSYNSNNPAQTTLTQFKTGGGEAFAEHVYWSSTQANALDAWAQSFSEGQQLSTNKASSSFYVRAVRMVAI